MKKIVVLAISLSVFLPARAYKLFWGRSVTISRPVYEDLYIAGGTVNINAPVYGDLIVAGGNITINDTIINDLLLAGGKVIINGFVGDDIRSAGGELHLFKNIGGDLVITGGKVWIEKGVVVNGGLIASGGEVYFDGAVNGDVRSAAGKFIFNGSTLGNFESRSEQLTINGNIGGQSILAARQINIGDQAAFNNSVRYWNKKGILDFKQSIRSGTAIYDPSLKVKGRNWFFLGRATLLGLLWYLGMVLLFIVLIQYLFSNTLRKAGDTFFDSGLRSLGWGFLFFIGVPVAILLLLLTVIGIPIGLLVLFTYIGLIVLATIITSVVTANWLNNRFHYQWSFWQLVLSALVMFVLFKLITFTPFLGWLIMMLLVCIAFGSIIQNINWRRKHGIAA